MSTQTCCPIVELRQYTLQPGKRGDLIEIFDREFVESQEELGMRIIGQFQDLDNPNRFVWLRGFPNMPTRAEALTAFYSGPVWKANRNEANATMVDVNNVLLLRPALPTSGFQLENFKRPPAGTIKTPTGSCNSNDLLSGCGSRCRLYRIFRAQDKAGFDECRRFNPGLFRYRE